MKKLFLALTVLGSVIASSLTAFGYEDRRDHDWNDDYWHHHHYGYWHGERGYWRYHDHKHEFIRVGPDWGGLRTTLENKGITLTHNKQPKVGAIRQAAKALGQFIQA